MNGTTTQQLLILNLISEAPKTLRELAKHNILSPGKRISELVALGFGISKERVLWVDSEGVRHKVMRYTRLKNRDLLTIKGELVLSLLRNNRREAV